MSNADGIFFRFARSWNRAGCEYPLSQISCPWSLKGYVMRVVTERLKDRDMAIELRRRTKVIGRFPGETSCLTLVWAVLDLLITHQTNGINFSDNVRCFKDLGAQAKGDPAGGRRRVGRVPGIDPEPIADRERPRGGPKRLEWILLHDVCDDFGANSLPGEGEGRRARL